MLICIYLLVKLKTDKLESRNIGLHYGNLRIARQTVDRA
jgi:hypothetical protein